MTKKAIKWYCKAACGNHQRARVALTEFLRDNNEARFIKKNTLASVLGWNDSMCWLVQQKLLCKELNNKINLLVNDIPVMTAIDFFSAKVIKQNNWMLTNGNLVTKRQWFTGLPTCGILPSDGFVATPELLRPTSFADSPEISDLACSIRLLYPVSNTFSYLSRTALFTKDKMFDIDKSILSFILGDHLADNIIQMIRSRVNSTSTVASLQQRVSLLTDGIIYNRQMISTLLQGPSASSSTEVDAVQETQGTTSSTDPFFHMSF